MLVLFPVPVFVETLLELWLLLMLPSFAVLVTEGGIAGTGTARREVEVEAYSTGRLKGKVPEFGYADVVGEGVLPGECPGECLGS